MFRQAFTTSSRALRAAPRLAAAPRPFIRSQFNSASAFTLRATQPAASRWYSDAKEEPAKPVEEAKTEQKEEASGETDAVAELKKALEIKENEARDWKVRLH